MIDAKADDLSVEERNLMSVAFKNMIEMDRKAIKIVQEISAFDKFQGYHELLTAQRKKIQKHLIEVCMKLISLCKFKCLPLAGNSESKVFFYKMIGDYHRYAAESFQLNEHDDESYRMHFHSVSNFYTEGL